MAPSRSPVAGRDSCRSAVKVHDARVALPPPPVGSRGVPVMSRALWDGGRDHGLTLSACAEDGDGRQTDLGNVTGADNARPQLPDVGSGSVGWAIRTIDVCQRLRRVSFAREPRPGPSRTRRKHSGHLRGKCRAGGFIESVLRYGGSRELRLLSHSRTPIRAGWRSWHHRLARTCRAPKTGSSTHGRAATRAGLSEMLFGAGYETASLSACLAEVFGVAVMMPRWLSQELLAVNQRLGSEARPTTSPGGGKR
jgi:hypothetical protein